MNPAPIVILAYKRVWHLKQTLEAIEKNPLATETDLIVYSDGPKYPDNKEDIATIEALREMVKSKQWCKNVKLISCTKNKGLNDAFVDGITEVINQYGKAIILEEDIVVSPFFLEYMNKALDLYNDEKKVMSISGYIFGMKTQNLPTSFFLNIPNGWGWGTWKDRWDKFINDPKEILEKIKEKNAYQQFTVDGSYPDFWNQLIDNVNGKANTWDLKWLGTVVVNDGLSLYPKYSLVTNTGFDGSGSHFHSGESFFEVKAYEQAFEINKSEITESIPAKKSLKDFFYKQQPSLWDKIKYKIKLLIKN